MLNFFKCEGFAFAYDVIGFVKSVTYLWTSFKSLKMKTTRLFPRNLVEALIFFLISQVCFGQLTISNNCPLAGSKYVFQIFDTTSLVNKSSGNILLWDLSGAVKSQEDTFTYQSPTAFLETLFPTANLSETDDNFTFYLYSLQSSSSELFFNGVIDSVTKLVFTDPILLIKYPFAVGGNLTDSFQGSYSGDRFGTIAGNYSIKGIGAGTVILPGNRSIDVSLITEAIYTHTISIDTPWVYQASVIQKEYSLYDASYRYPIAFLSYSYIYESPLRTEFELRISDYGLKLTIPESQRNSYDPIKYYTDSEGKVTVVSERNMHLLVSGVTGQSASFELFANVPRRLELGAGLHFMQYDVEGRTKTVKFISD